jgi:hypothetical protein
MATLHLSGLALQVTLGATLACGWMLSACGGSSAGTTPDAGPDSHHDGGHETGTQDTGTLESGPKETGAGDGPAPDRTPITGLTSGTWTWVPFAGALCRDGSSTGIGVNIGTSSNVMIFLEGGGACFNFESCDDYNPSSFSEADFMSLTTTGYTGAGGSYLANVGILDRTNAANPVQDWSFVYVPYCTGDVHGGNNVASVPGLTIDGKTAPPQHFVGWVNMSLYLDRLVPTFPGAKQVLLSGMSGGGFGAAVNYPQVAKAFGSTPVTMLDDSGPFFEDPYLAVCLQNEVRALWGLDKTLLPECGGDCSNPSSYFLDYVLHYVKAYPKVDFGLADSTDDGTITNFFGFGADDCKIATQETGAVFTAGLLDVRAKLASQANYGEFVFTGTDHTSIQGAEFYTRTAGGAEGGAPVLMTDWVTGLLSGTATNPGP